MVDEREIKALSKLLKLFERVYDNKVKPDEAMTIFRSIIEEMETT